VSVPGTLRFLWRCPASREVKWLKGGSLAYVSNTGQLQPASSGCGVLVVPRHPAARELQRGPNPSLRGFVFSRENFSSVYKCSVFLFAWKNQCKPGENFHGLSFHHLLIELLAQSLFFFYIQYLQELLYPDQDTCGQRAD